MQIESILHPGQFDALRRRDLTGVAAVVFDVLRATSAELTALANGARAIVPVETLSEARALRERDASMLLGGERGGLRPEGFDFGNSPWEYEPGKVRGRIIAHTTTNGTVALRACEKASAVYLGAFLNLGALAARVMDRGPDRLLLVCAGTFSHFALEDAMAAGALVERLAGARPELAPSARACLSVWRSSGRSLESSLGITRNGRRLRDLGLERDIADCARLDSLDRVARLEDGAVRIA